MILGLTSDRFLRRISDHNFSKKNDTNSKEQSNAQHDIRKQELNLPELAKIKSAENRTMFNTLNKTW